MESEIDTPVLTETTGLKINTYIQNKAVDLKTINLKPEVLARIRRPQSSMLCRSQTKRDLFPNHMTEAIQNLEMTTVQESERRLSKATSMISMPAAYNNGVNLPSSY